MISDPKFWKDTLLRLARRLENRPKQRRWTPCSVAAVHWEVSSAMFLIRRLCEAGALRPGAWWERVPVTSHRPPTGDVPASSLDLLRCYGDGRYYQLEAGRLVQKVVHSDHFQLRFGDGKELEGIVFRGAERASNGELPAKAEYVYDVDVPDLVNVMRSAAREQPPEGVAE